MKDKNLIIPIYLNQKIVFDLLAIFEDGFSQMRSVQRANNSESSILASVDGEIGTSNIFALLGVKLKAGIGTNNKDANSELINEERIHTPTSLFSKLLERLENNNMIRTISEYNDLEKIQPGEFIAFKGTLQKNPIISLMESMERMMELAVAFDTGSQINQSPNKGNNKNRNKDPNKVILNQMKSMTDSLKIGGMIDILCNINNSENIIAVLQTYIDFFNNKTMNELIDGEYSVLGKVVKITTTNNNGEINLLRNTSLSLANEQLMSHFTSAFNNSEMQKAGLKSPHVETKIKGNGILVIPIAIYS